MDDHQHVARDHEVDVDVRREHFPVHDHDVDNDDSDNNSDVENERIPAGRLREDKLPDNPSVENAPWIKNCENAPWNFSDQEYAPSISLT